MPGMEDIKDESFIKAEIHNSINYMLDCLLDKKERKCNSCKCVDACSLLTEAVLFAVQEKSSSRYNQYNLIINKDSSSVTPIIPFITFQFHLLMLS